MPKGYWIGRVDVDDPDKYNEYIAAAAVPFKKYGARLVVGRGTKFETVEGKSRARNVVIEFPSYQAALDCWHSPEYERALAIRASITRADIIVIEGYDGPHLW
jgi:uncharacterized protein (DUF1330 family)